ncbi:MAG: Cof-type HAD-IIB family hydrolase [Blautia sp.]|nr:Cof-type HAD-IIB family hydrolase [Blautia sp.]
MNRKLVFFDIDRTIWDRKNYIPPGTVEAIRMLRKNGHLVFINSGRARGYIFHPDLLEIGFDGIISGCGTMVEYQGKTVYCHMMDNDFAADTIKMVREYGFRPILEGVRYLYFDEEEFGGDPYGEKLRSDLGDRLRTIKNHWANWDIVKFSCATDHADRTGCFRELEQDFDFMIHNETVAEIVPKGYHKGVGISKVCELLGEDRKDTIAFGDSANDLGMFSTAGFSVCMGNGTEEARAAADYVTSGLYEDGIWNACRYLNLI